MFSNVALMLFREFILYLQKSTKQKQRSRRSAHLALGLVHHCECLYSSHDTRYGLVDARHKRLSLNVAVATPAGTGSSARRRHLHNRLLTLVYTLLLVLLYNRQIKL